MHSESTDESSPKEILPPSQYNIFMENEMNRIANAYPHLPHKEVFILAANNVTSDK